MSAPLPQKKRPGPTDDPGSSEPLDADRGRPVRPASLPLLNAIAIALTAFMVGLYVGSTFLGTKPVPSASTGAVSGLPPGHPPIDPNAPPVSAPPLDPASAGTSGLASSGAAVPTTAPPGSAVADASAAGDGASSGKAAAGRYDLTYDDPAVRGQIASTSDYGGLVRMGNEQFDARHPRPAIAAYEKALKIHPFDPDVQTDLGVMYRAMGRTDEALNAFRKAASLDTHHLQSRYNIGVVLENDEGDLNGALRAWRDYLRVAPSGPQADEVKRRVTALEQQGAKG